MNKLRVGASPHVHSKRTTQKIMLDVIIALIPSLIASCFIFGPRSLVVTAVCVSSCVVFEAICRLVMKRDMTIGDLSAVVTGILLAFNLPVNIPLWMCLVGSAAAIVVAKQFFGGLGQNFVNPAIAGRIVMLVSFSSAMTSWVAPRGVDAESTATPLSILKHYNAESVLPSIKDMVLGVRGGSLGETCAIALIIGFIYLLCRRVIKPTIPLIFTGTVFVCMLLYSKFDFEFALIEILSGGLLLGSIFMATDYVTSPITTKGKVVYAIGCGLITSVIRLFGNLPEGVSYSIILMNILTPLIEGAFKSKPFGKRTASSKSRKKSNDGENEKSESNSDSHKSRVKRNEKKVKENENG